MSETPQKPGRHLNELPPAQREILEIIWSLGEASANDLLEELHPDRPVARTTVLTLLQRLEEAGWLQHRQEGRIYIYSPARSRRAALGRALGAFIQNVFSGSPVELLTALLDRHQLSDSESDRIREMIDKASEDKERSKGGER